MKEKVFSTNSWHYWLATAFGNGFYRETNICVYWRTLLLNSALLLIFGILGIMAAWVFIYAPIGGVLAYLFDIHPYLYPNDLNGVPALMLAFTFGLLDVFIVVGYLCVAYGEQVCDYVFERFFKGRSTTKPTSEPKPDSFIVTWYRSFKDKTCFKVTFTTPQK